ncbi:MAG: hypothetical protein AAFN74_04115, partial [Myxococcota bacterium]
RCMKRRLAMIAALALTVGSFWACGEDEACSRLARCCADLGGFACGVVRTDESACQDALVVLAGQCGW